MNICIFTAVMNAYKMEGGGKNRMPVMVLCESECVKFQLSDTSAFMMENYAVHSGNCEKRKNETKLRSDSIVQFNVPIAQQPKMCVCVCV